MGKRIQIAHKTRIHLNNKQTNFFRQCCGVRRFAYNWALTRWKLEYACKQEYSLGSKPSAMSIDKQFNAIKKEQFPWIYEVPSCVAQRAICYDLKNAMQHFFRRLKTAEKPGFPKYKSRHVRDSFNLTNVHLKPEDICGKTVKLPKKMGFAKLGSEIRYQGKLKGTTISRAGEKWYASFLIETEEDLGYRPATGDPVVLI